jgi:cell fate (sporulation/competence/biofilm development) regulator YmcA (YheA/YmcA/DUF963 family)
MNDALAQAEGAIEEFEEKLDDLGADSPKLDSFKKELAELEDLINTLKRKIEDL